MLYGNAMAKRKKLGRPLREGGPRLSRVFRADKAEYDAILEAAEAKGLPVTTWIRSTLLRAARRTRKGK